MTPDGIPRDISISSWSICSVCRNLRSRMTAIRLWQKVFRLLLVYYYTASLNYTKGWGGYKVCLSCIFPSINRTDEIMSIGLDFLTNVYLIIDAVLIPSFGSDFDRKACTVAIFARGQKTMGRGESVALTKEKHKVFFEIVSSEASCQDPWWSTWPFGQLHFTANVVECDKSPHETMLWCDCRTTTRCLWQVTTVLSVSQSSCQWVTWKSTCCNHVIAQFGQASTKFVAHWQRPVPSSEFSCASLLGAILRLSIT